MNITVNKELLCQYVSAQLNNFFPDYINVESRNISQYIDDTLDRLEFCFKHIQKPYYNYGEGIEMCFNYLHGDHYAMFLYILSNTIYKVDKNENLASKVFLLNKALHGIDAFYNIELPEIFLFVHPVGTILGRAKYEDYFVVYQNCSVGATEEGIYPTFSKETILYSKCSVIGNCKIGNNVVFSANATIINTDILSNSVVLGNFPNNKIISNKKNVIDRIFR